MTTLSIICPTLNEEKFLESTIQSFLDQKYSSFELEILIVDGMSTDRTRELVLDFQNRFPAIRLLNNEQKRTPFAFNIGLKEAKGEFVAILGAHTDYAPDYLETCYRELLKNNAAGCTGRIISKAPSNNTGAMTVQWIMDNPFGVSGSSFRTVKEGYVHSVNFAVFHKKALLDLGGYDTTLLRNQDNDMNQRLLDAGHKLYCTWKTQCYYYTPPTLKKLFKYAFNNGYWNAISLILKARSMRFYHFIPFLFLMFLFCFICLSIIEFVFAGSNYVFFGLVVVLLLYGAAGTVFTLLSFGKQADFRKLLLPFFFFCFHISYGWGTLRGLVYRMIKYRP